MLNTVIDYSGIHGHLLMGQLHPTGRRMGKMPRGHNLLMMRRLRDTHALKQVGHVLNRASRSAGSMHIKRLVGSAGGVGQGRNQVQVNALRLDVSHI